MMDLDKIRKDIDHIDQQITQLLIERYDLVKDVKIYKENHQLPILDQSREDVINSKLKDLKYSDELIKIYHLIMSLSKDIQNK